ncbi:MAG: hypothetical protein A2X05_16860 [Bacteroidetes bacterium GWE2_41_25]|nr:MAG: hypothetical protein A2X03_19185 [Bacteroidetes bacterium GWA2_40_15]OFX86749.1 MAG: hypothetical protein A2X06_17815 [Bacteroidetes bacterium GWC2_40_22]OFY06935.1 MAG: hypothetical protein A2X05_16860 [Bacteroidetes bacterium GWE2_41_25]HBH85958.1 hypothetical protein [Bacteroidales bacterium]HBQ81434.1 hypothetical protein [Bacteroidales bacterium]
MAMKGNITLLTILFILCFSCRNSSTKETEFVFPEADSIPQSEAEKLSPEAIEDISRNISSPVEIANLLQMLEVPFSSQYLASSIDANKENTTFDKALKLGILGADLGYLNMYEKTGSSLDLLSSIRKLAEDIRVGQFFDFEMIKRLSQNRSSLDSLLYISIDSYEQIDSYLRTNGRGQLSALMIIGVWIEGQYLATQVVDKYPDKILSDRIGEQKIILNDLLLLITPFCNNSPEFSSLCKDLYAMKDNYRDIRIIYTQGEPVASEKEGGLVITQTETSIVEMSEAQLKGLIEITSEIRNRLILND